MDSTQILSLQFALSLLVYGLIARWFVVPRLAAMPLPSALLPLLLFQAMRHLGMTFLVPAVVDPNLPRAFALPAAYGDLLASLLALLSVFALRARWAAALALVWVFNLWGSLDLLNAIVQGFRLSLARYQLGAAWYIPTFIVPAMLVIHYMIFQMILSHPARRGMA